MLTKGSISILQAFMLLIMAIGLDNHVTIIPLLLHTANKDSWISVILVLPICVLWTLLPFWIAKLTRQKNIFVWLRNHTHPALALLLLIPFLAFLVTNAFVTFKEVITWTKVSYLPETPILVTSFCLIALCTYTACKGIRSIAVCAGILLPVVWILGYFVMTASFQFKRYNLLFPVFTNPMSSILSCMMYAAGSFLEVFLMVLVQHRLIGKLRWYHLMILVVLIFGLTIGPLTGAIASFGYKATQIRYPSFEQWRLVRIGNYVSHLDFLSIYQWLSGAFIRLAFALYLIGDMLHGKSERVRKSIVLGTAGVLFLLVIQPFINDRVYLQIAKDYYIGAFYIQLLSSLWLLPAVYWASRNRRT